MSSFENLSLLSIAKYHSIVCHVLYKYLIKPSKLVHGNFVLFILLLLIIIKAAPNLHDRVLITFEQKLSDGSLHKYSGLDPSSYNLVLYISLPHLNGGEHVGDAPLHEEVPPYKLC